MANFPIRGSGNSEVPLGGTATASIKTKESGAAEDVNTVQVIWKDNNGTTISDETWSGSTVSTTASDGGAITITDTAGTGTYEAKYTVPNDATYSPPTSGLAFSVQIIAVDEDGTADTGAVAFSVMPADVTVSLDRTTTLATVKRRTEVLEDVLIVPNTVGTTRLDLGTGIIYAVDAAYKNGSAIAGGGTDYTWATFQTNVDITVASADNDHFVFRVQRFMSDDAITDYIEESEDFILGKLRCIYDDTDILTYPTVQAMIVARSVGYIKEELSKGVALESPQYRTGRELIDETTAMCKAIANGTICIVDDDGDEVSRNSSSLSGGFVHPNGSIGNRLAAVDRAQRWTGILQNYYPESSLLLNLTSSRVF